MVDTESIDMELLSRPVKGSEYSDSTAYLMAKMSDWAYLKFEKPLLQSNDEKIIFEKFLKDAKFPRVIPFNNHETQAFLAINPIEKIAILAFRGTEIGQSIQDFKILDVLTDLTATFKKIEDYKVHTGFYKAFQYVEKDIKETIKDLIGYKIYITGHSLGAALALIATQRCDLENIKIEACYVFGCPRVGNRKFCNKIKTPIYRIVNESDIVTAIPPTRFFFVICVLLIILIPQFLTRILTLVVLCALIVFCQYKHYGKIIYLKKSGNKKLIKYNMFFFIIHSIHVTWCSIGFPGWCLLKGAIKRIWEFIIKRKQKRFLDNIKSIKPHNISAYCDKLEKLAKKELR